MMSIIIYVVTLSHKQFDSVPIRISFTYLGVEPPKHHTIERHNSGDRPCPPGKAAPASRKLIR